jgi:hypothetical protein
VTPDQEEQVRRALGAVARAEDGPERQGIPHDVAARLDEVLHELVAGRSAPARTLSAAVGQDELAARRHRRWPNGLVAAAAVAAIAAAGGAVVTGGFGLGGQSDSNAGSTSDAGVAPKDNERGLPGPSLSSGPSGGPTALRIPRLSSETLRRDVEQVVKTGPETYLSPNKDGRRLIAPRRADGIRCALPTVSGGSVVVDVLLDNVAATLVLRPGKDGSRAARVYSCVNASPLTDTVRVPSTH